MIIWVTKSSESTKKCISRGITLHTVVAHFQLWEIFCRFWHAEHFCSLNFPSISNSFWDIRWKYSNLEHFDEKRAITPKWVMGFTSKLRGRKILTCCKFLQFKLTFISYIGNFWNVRRKVLKFSKIWWKKGNNSKMGNRIYFKIAWYIDLDMLNIFAI